MNKRWINVRKLRGAFCIAGWLLCERDLDWLREKWLQTRTDAKLLQEKNKKLLRDIRELEDEIISLKATVQVLSEPPPKRSVPRPRQPS